MRKILNKVKIFWHDSPKSEKINIYKSHNSVTEGLLITKNEEYIVVGHPKTEKYHPKSKRFVPKENKLSFLTIPTEAIASLLLIV